MTLQTEQVLQQSAQYIKGVGPAKFKLLNRLGVYTVADLLYYFPRRYEDRRNFLPIAHLRAGDYATVKGEVSSRNLWHSRRGMAIFQILLRDQSGVLKAVWFNQPFMSKYLKIGQKVILYGKVELVKRPQMNTPEFEFISGKDSSLHVGRITPIYPLTAHLNQRYLRSTVNKALEHSHSYIPDVLPYNFRQRLKLLPLTLAIRYIHFPADFEKKDAAYRRLVFDEFFLLQLILSLKKLHQSQTKSGISHQTEGGLIERFKQSLPFKLTAHQEQAIKEIAADMRSPRAMNRLLQGDVGSGKTIVALYAMVLSVQSGFQAALMVPTEILAEQHYLSLSKLLLSLEINVGMLVSGMSRSARENTLIGLKSGELNIVVGTHALIEEDLEFKNLGLIVIDEQHKFGVLQRLLLHQKGKAPDCLVMTATPIPRTLAMTVYGDLDISTIKELPQGRKPISTFWVREDALASVYNFLREEVAQGRQAFLVYPLVKQSPILELKAATQMYRRLSKEEFTDLRLGLIHGQLKSQEKEKVMRAFKERKIDILIATTVIEVGIDIPNASVMVIEQAERFGLSQLHQLRGRIGRGVHPSYCILVSQSSQTEAAQQRIEAMLNTQDGFQLAEQDLDIRGPGRFFGPAQHGLPELKIGNIVQDLELMELARSEAFSLVKQDPRLTDPQHLLLRNKLKEKFRSQNLGLLLA